MPNQRKVKQTEAKKKKNWLCFRGRFFFFWKILSNFIFKDFFSHFENLSPLKALNAEDVWVSKPKESSWMAHAWLTSQRNQRAYVFKNRKSKINAAFLFHPQGGSNHGLLNFIKDNERSMGKKSDARFISFSSALNGYSSEAPFHWKENLKSIHFPLSYSWFLHLATVKLFRDIYLTFR